MPDPQTIKLNPSFSKGYSRKGSALHGQREYEASVAAYKAGLEIEPSSTILKKGLEEVERAIEKDGKSTINHSRVVVSGLEDREL